MSHIELNNISYRINQKVILDDVSLRIEPGQFITLIGPNGAGKTTLLKIIIGLLKPSQGLVHHAANLNIGYVPQKIKVNQLMPLRVKDFLELCIKADNRDLVYQELGIVKLLDESIHTLSGGELQRVLLAQAIGKFSYNSLTHGTSTQTPCELLILDEPTQGMDTHNQVELFKLLTTYNQHHNMTILMVSHDLNFVHQASTHVICLNKHICCHGKPQDISQMAAYQQLFPTLDSSLSLYAHKHNHNHDRITDTTHDCGDHS